MITSYNDMWPNGLKALWVHLEQCCDRGIIPVELMERVKCAILAITGRLGNSLPVPSIAVFQEGPNGASVSLDWGRPSPERRYFSLSFYANPPPKYLDTVWCINSYETELFPSTWEKSQRFPDALISKLQKHVCINPESNDDNTKANSSRPSPVP